jgi:hypothetical protein
MVFGCVSRLEDDLDVRTLRKIRLNSQECCPVHEVT